MAVSQEFFIKESELNNYYHRHKVMKYRIASTNQKRKIHSKAISIEVVKYQFSKIKERQVSSKSVALRLVEASLRPKCQQATTESTLPVIQSAVNPVTEGNAWDVLEALIGTIDAPSDWSSEHDYYLYGTPKHQPETIE